MRDYCSKFGIFASSAGFVRLLQVRDLHSKCGIYDISAGFLLQIRDLLSKICFLAQVAFLCQSSDFNQINLPIAANHQ